MKQLTVKRNEAMMVDDKGKIHITRMESGVWVFQGKTYRNPFEAFKEVENADTKRILA